LVALSPLPCVSAAGSEPAAGAKPPVARAGEVTLKGVLMLEDACTPKAPKETRHMVVLFALEGTPEVATTLDAVMKENWPGDSMDANQARHLNDAFSARLWGAVASWLLTGSCLSCLAVAT